MDAEQQKHTIAKAQVINLLKAPLKHLVLREKFLQMMITCHIVQTFVIEIVSASKWT